MPSAQQSRQSHLWASDVLAAPPHVLLHSPNAGKVTMTRAEIRNTVLAAVPEPSGFELRDHFAGQVICTVSVNVLLGEPGSAYYERLAKEAYKLADAMVEARKG